MDNIIFDGGLSIAELIALDCIIEDLPITSRERFINEYKEENPEGWEHYLNHRNMMSYSKL